MRMATMLAAKLYKVGEPMRLEQVPVPSPRPTDVLVAVKACGVVPNLINVLTHWRTWFPELPLRLHQRRDRSLKASQSYRQRGIGRWSSE
jgi:hypothetical protein